MAPFRCDCLTSIRLGHDCQSVAKAQNHGLERLRRLGNLGSLGITVTL